MSEYPLSTPLLKFKVGYYQLVTRRVAEFSAQKAAREVHESEQRIAPTRLLCQEAIKGVRLAAEKSRAVVMAIHADDSVLEGGRHVQI